MTKPSACHSCERLAFRDPAPRDRVVSTEAWSVAHAFNANLEGWLVVLPRRHVEGLDELTLDEANELGALLRALSVALREVTGCVKTYVLLLAEAEGFSHVHLHVVPRAAEMDDAHRGARVFTLLGNADLDQVTSERMDELATSLRASLQPLGYDVVA
jgi:diadenosine tetraphosphate (Ap4A) HIT family hydrolase